MIQLVYHVDLENKQDELDWLRSQKIYPACREAYDWKLQRTVAQFGVIVGSEAALTIKLRHRLDLQTDWKQR